MTNKIEDGDGKKNQGNSGYSTLPNADKIDRAAKSSYSGYSILPNAEKIGQAERNAYLTPSGFSQENRTSADDPLDFLDNFERDAKDEEVSLEKAIEERMSDNSFNSEDLLRETGIFEEVSDLEEKDELDNQLEEIQSGVSQKRERLGSFLDDFAEEVKSRGNSPRSSAKSTDVSPTRVSVKNDDLDSMLQDIESGEFDKDKKSVSKIDNSPRNSPRVSVKNDDLDSILKEIESGKFDQSELSKIKDTIRESIAKPAPETSNVQPSKKEGPSIS